MPLSKMLSVSAPFFSRLLSLAPLPLPSSLYLCPFPVHYRAGSRRIRLLLLFSLLITIQRLCEYPLVRPILLNECFEFSTVRHLLCPIIHSPWHSFFIFSCYDCTLYFFLFLSTHLSGGWGKLMLFLFVEKCILAYLNGV